MHGHSPGLGLNAEVDSMGGIVDGGVGVDTKTSPCRAAIEKAQAELRQEYDVREEWRRELEFLEKGGNPLDFEFGHATSISIQSTSPTDQLAEQYVISEAKGSFAVAASPHGDSVESSGRLGASMGREPNIADNILHFDGESNILDEERNVVHTGKRGNIAPLEQSSGCNIAKESEDSVMFHLGVKRQAYARRNRSRSSRDSAHVGSTDLFLGHSNRSSILPSSCHDPSDANGSLWETQAEDYAGSSNSKPASPDGTVSKNLASDDQLFMELDAVQAQHTRKNMIKVGDPEAGTEDKSSENQWESNPNTRHSQLVVKQGPNGTTFLSSEFVGKDETVSVGLVYAPLESSEYTKDITSTERASGLSVEDKDVADLQIEDQNSKNRIVDTVTDALSTKNIETVPSLANICNSLDGNAEVDQCSMLRAGDDSDGDSKEQNSVHEFAVSAPDNNVLKENCALKIVVTHVFGNDKPGSVHPEPSNSSIQVKDEKESFGCRTGMQSELRPLTNIESTKLNGEVVSRSETLVDNLLGDSSISNDHNGRVLSTLVSTKCEPSTATLSRKGSATTAEFQNCTGDPLKLAKKAHEDVILKKAQIIEDNLKRAGESYMFHIPSDKRQKCHWDFVLEEMAWMANDFMQERVWKTTAAAEVCRWIASSSQPKFEKEIICRKQRSIARTLAKGIMQFWHSAELLQVGGQPTVGIYEECDSDLCRLWKVNGADSEKNQGSKYLEASNSGSVLRPPVLGYAVSFLKYNSLPAHPILAEAPITPDRISDACNLEMSWDDQFTEENLFYRVPPGAMQVYRESVESQYAHYKKAGNTVCQEDCEASICDYVADGTRENAYEEDEGETGMYYLSGAFEGSKSSIVTHKKRKNPQHKSYATRTCEVGTGLQYEHCLENKLENQSILLMRKRPSSTLNVGSIPTKRARTAARQRMVSHTVGATGSLQVTSKTDASSGDTNSFQDDQSSLHGEFKPKKNLEIELTMDFEQQLSFDCTEISTKSKKKKTPKYLGYRNSLNSNGTGGLVDVGKGSSYEQRHDFMAQQEQKDHLRRRLDSHHFESNGNTGLYSQHVAKKPKLLKQQPETSLEAINLVTEPVPSPVASQMSNMSNPNRLFKIIANRDRVRKNKAMKTAAGQSGSGSPWSLFEDQVLVVLVHDMGSNWELVSDAINSTLQFKCIFRKPKECKERHKYLMDKTVSDGADSAEDSGSSQPYPSTLPGIPKGSARQLFQRLQGPMEEDTLKAHFEKIILIGHKLHFHRSQNGSQELKQRNPAHSSHALALSQACPNNLTGGVLTPLDLCEATTSSPEVLALGYQGSHTSGLAIPSQGSIATALPSSGANSMLQGSPGMVLGSSLPSPSASLNPPARDSQRYGVPRPISLPVDEQQKMAQYNQMLSGRNIPQSSMSVPGALPVGTDRGVRMLPGGNGMGMMRGMNRGMPIPRPGFQGISSPGVLNMVSTSSMLSTSGVGMPNPVNVHPSAVSGPGNLMLRPHDALQMLRPGQSTENHRQMMMQELQLQVSQGNGQAVTPANGMGAPLSNSTVPPVQTFPVQRHQQPHHVPQQPLIVGNSPHPHIQGTKHANPQQQAYAIRLAKERHQRQQRLLHQPQQPFSCSNAISPLQNSSQIQQQTQSSSPVAPIPSSQAQHKQQQHMPWNPQSGSVMPNQMMKQRHRQQSQQQQPSHHQQQRQEPQQQAQLMKGLGRGTMMMHRNLPTDGSYVSSLSTAPKIQVSEKHLMQQGEGFIPGGSSSNSTLTQPSNQQKMYSRPLAQSSKQMPPSSSHSDNCNQVSVQIPPNHAFSTSHQPLGSSLPLASQQQQQQQQRQSNQSQQTMQRMILQQNRQMNSDGPIQSSADQVPVNQMIPASSIPQCADSISIDSVVSSAPISTVHWKLEPSYDTSTPIPTSHLAISPQSNLVGTESIMPSSGQGSAQMQFSARPPTHGQGIGGQWQQQQQQQQPQQQQPLQQHRQAGHGNFYAQPSNSGPG